MQSQKSQKSQRNRDAVKKCRARQKKRLEFLSEENIVLRRRLTKYKMKYKKMKQMIAQTQKPEWQTIDLTKDAPVKQEHKRIKQEQKFGTQEHDFLSAGQLFQLATAPVQESKAETIPISSAQPDRHSPWSILQAPVHTPTSECKS